MNFLSNMEKSIGGLWIKSTSQGKKYLSGVVEWNGEKIRVVVFKNERKSKENSPDYSILKAKTKDEIEAEKAVETSNQPV